MFVRLIFRVTERDSDFQKSELRYKTLIESANFEFYLHDYAGKILESNSAACKKLGYSRAELVNLNVSEFVAASTITELQARWDKLEPGKIKTRLSKQTRKDGSSYAVNVRLSPIILGGMTCIIALIKDVTARQNAEKEISRLQEKLACYGRPHAAEELSAGLAHKLNQPWQRRQITYKEPFSAYRKYLLFRPTLLRHCRERTSKICAPENLFSGSKNLYETARDTPFQQTKTLRSEKLAI